MSLTLSRSGAVVTAVLAGELRVQHVTALKAQLLQGIDAETSLLLQPSGVTRIDTSVVQLLCFAARMVQDVRVEGPSPAWSSAWTLLGLALPSNVAAAPIVHPVPAVPADAKDH